MPAQLIYAPTEETQLCVPVGARLLLGRSAESGLKVLGHNLSRQHAELRETGDGYELVDLGSSNGTFLNDQRLTSHQPVSVSPGDLIRLGTLELRFAQGGSDEEPEPAGLQLLLQTITELHLHEDPQATLPAIVDRVLRLTGAERGLLLIRGDREGLETWVARDKGGEDLGHVQGTSRSIPLQVLETGVPLCITGEDQDALPASQSMNDHDLAAALCVPIRQRGEVRGVIYVDSHEPTRSFGPTEQEMLEALAAQCGVAIERAAIRRDEVAERRRLEEENAALKGDDLPRPVAESPAMLELLRRSERVAGSGLTILITGETGVGKEVLARWVHGRSNRRGAPFVVVDCGAIPETLLESVLFGHVKGAFTGAEADQTGLFQAADGGTLLLDEIGELPLALQPKLLRFLQERTFRPVGSGDLRSVDVRVLACTLRDLPAMVKAGTFREDLLFRLNTFPIEVPPLRARREDVLPLARRLLASARAESKATTPTGFTHDALAALEAYAWPGNVRELAQRMRRAVVISGAPLVTCADLDLDSITGAAGPPLLPLKDARKEAHRAAMDRFEVEYVTALLRRHRGQVQKAAEAGGVSRQMLQRLMARHGIKRQAFLPE